MRFEDSPISKSIAYKKMVFDFGSYYFCDNYIVIEVNEDEHFNLKKLGVVLNAVIDHYGNDVQIAYIANRINVYSIDPILWSYYDKRDSVLVAGSIISYRNSTFMNANLEKQMAGVPIKRSKSLEESINWVNQLKELN